MKNRIRNSQNRIRNSDEEKWTARDMAYRPGGLPQSEQELVAWSRNLTDLQLDCVDRILMQQALNALEYHTAQTRPIANTDEVIKALRARLAQPDLAQVGEVGVWGKSKA